MTVYLLFCRLLLAIVLAAAALAKGRTRSTRAAFTTSLADFRWLPSALMPVTAVAVLAAELAASVMLVLGQPAGAVLGVAMLVVFTAATLQAGRAAACQCFGSSASAGSGSTALFLLRNAVLTGAGISALLGTASYPAVAPALIVATAAATVAAVLIGLEEVSYGLRAIVGRS